MQGYDPDALYAKWQDAMHADAKARADANGTSEAYEYGRMMKQLEKGASKAKGKRALGSAPKIKR